MKNALILHGTFGTSQDNWFLWLKDALEQNGWKVWVPDLPHAEKPNIARYNEYIFGNKEWEFTKDTIIIGHSSGAVAALGVVENLPEDTFIDRVILVSAFINDLGWDALDELFVKPFDYEKIKKHVKHVTLIHSDDDPYCPVWHAETLAKELNGELLMQHGQGHFNTEKSIEFTKFPYLLECIESYYSN